MNSIYPVGSLYFGTQSTCPLQSAGIGTWTRIATNFVTGSTAPVIGNGKTLGLTDGTNQWGLVNNGNTSTWEMFNTNASGTDIGTRASGTNGPNTNNTVGITQDAEKSGILADLPTYTVNVWRRTA